MSAPRVWAVPAGLAASSLLGLGAALVADGIWDALSWLALGTPLVVIAQHVCAR